MNASTTEGGGDSGGEGDGQGGGQGGGGRARAPGAGAVRTGHAVLHRWPTAVGVLVAVASYLTVADRKTVGITIAIAATCYLTAAALERPWTAWAAIPGVTVLLIIGGLVGLAPLTTVAIVAAVLVVVGLILRVSRATLTAETAGVLGYGGLVVIGLAVAPTAGLIVVAVTLIAHAAWDVVHLRRGIVVPRSLAEFCIALDVLLGVAVLVGALTG